MNPKVIIVDRFEKFEKAIRKMEYRYWAFRGQGKVGWRIEPALARFYRSHQRNINPASYYPRELDSIRRFRKSAHLYLQHLPQEDDLLSWLAIMQHFGAPTRLIDFTLSPYAALFFAIQKSAPEIEFGEQPHRKDLDSRYRPYEVHAVHLKSVRLKTEEILDHAWPPKIEDYRIGNGTRQQKKFVGFFEGIWQNQRQVAQQGLFMVPSTLDMEIEDYLRDCPSSSKDFPDHSWIVFRFPGGQRSYSEMVKRLLRANVTAESLFPGLEGVAASICMGFYTPKITLG